MTLSDDLKDAGKYPEINGDFVKLPYSSPTFMWVGYLGHNPNIPIKSKWGRCPLCNKRINLERNERGEAPYHSCDNAGKVIGLQ